MFYWSVDVTIWNPIPWERKNFHIIRIPEPDDYSETADVCIEKIQEEICKLTDVHLILDQAFDQAHRVGPKMDTDSKNPEVSVVYGDIDNNICLMLTDWTKKSFNSEEELDTFL